jgi:hypothetical protein
MIRRIILLTVIIFAFFATALKSQVALYPTAAFIDPNTRTGSMVVINTSEQMRETKISLQFGYLSYDSLGNGFTEYTDAIAEKEFSLKPYLKVFPAKLLIPPQQQATLRFMVSGLPDTDDKFYWTRIIASSVPQTPQIDSVGEGQIAAQIIMKTEMVGLVGMLKGKNTATLDYRLDQVFTDTTKLILLMDYQKNGNSPFWGGMHIEIYDSNDELVNEFDQGLAIYMSNKQRIALDKEKFAPGKYKAKVTVVNRREEVPEDYLPPERTQTKEFDFEVK